MAVGLRARGPVNPALLQVRGGADQDDVGVRKISEITRPEARRIANGWPRATARIARTMWADAVRDGICDLNPWTNLRLETPKGRKDIDALTEQEIADLADLAAELSGDYGRRRGRSS